MNRIDLQAGEFTIGQPPTTQLNGENCVPQHYLSYQHSLASVEALVSQISFDPHFPIFVAEDKSGLYLQVGIIGVDNYVAKARQKTKIVYGRKWRVEPNLPTSEVIQTLLLALKTAREHELRECFRLEIQTTEQDETRTKVTTPFNNHHDLPLLIKKFVTSAALATEAPPCTLKAVEAILASISYDECQFTLLNMQPLTGAGYVIELEIQNREQARLPELLNTQHLGFVIEQLDINQLLHGLMTCLISLSNQYVEENFKFQGVARFSKQHSVLDIAHLSVATRQLHKQSHNHEFAHIWSQSNYETDLTRVPSVINSPFTQRLMQRIQQLGPISGPLPKVASS